METSISIIPKKRALGPEEGLRLGIIFVSPSSSSSSSLRASSCLLLLSSLVLSPWFLVHVECWDGEEDVWCHTQHPSASHTPFTQRMQVTLEMMLFECMMEM